MKISNKLPQFADKPALLIVAGEHEAEFYVAYNSSIKRIQSFNIPHTWYSDREDYEDRGQGLLFESGARFDKEDKLIIQNFVREFKVVCKEILRKNSIQHLYLFAPDYLRHIVGDCIPRPARKAIYFISGNFYKSHPFELLEKIRGGTMVRLLYS